MNKIEWGSIVGIVLLIILLWYVLLRGPSVQRIPGVSVPPPATTTTEWPNPTGAKG